MRFRVLTWDKVIDLTLLVTRAFAVNYQSNQLCSL